MSSISLLSILWLLNYLFALALSSNMFSRAYTRYVFTASNAQLLFNCANIYRNGKSNNNCSHKGSPYYSNYYYYFCYGYDLGGCNGKTLLLSFIVLCTKLNKLIVVGVIVNARFSSLLTLATLCVKLSSTLFINTRKMPSSKSSVASLFCENE